MHLVRPGSVEHMRVPLGRVRLPRDALSGRSRAVLEMEGQEGQGGPARQGRLGRHLQLGQGLTVFRVGCCGDSPR